MVSTSSSQENYVVEHLATFSTSTPSQQPITPKVAIQRLFAMEKTSGIWTQRMFVKIEGEPFFNEFCLNHFFLNHLLIDNFHL